MKILVVHEHRHVLEACRLCLEPAGYLVETAYDADEALAAMDMLEFDLLVIDEHIRRMSAHKLLEWHHTHRREVPVLVLVEKMTDLTLRPFITESVCKPFSVPAFVALVGGILASL
ncbi:MAG: response regulator [Candidatus Berkelbacteria bacterium]